MFKIITKPIRWILRIVLGLGVMALIPVFLLYKSVTPPELTNETFNIEQIVSNELDYLIDDSNTDKKMSLYLTENLLNNEIKKAVLSQVGTTNQSDDYIYDTEYIKLQGAWVVMSENKVDIIVGLHLNAVVAKMKTRALISFDIINDKPTELVLKLDKAKLGNLSLKWALKLIPSLAERFLGESVDDTINTLFESIGSYDKAEQKVTVDFKKLAARADNDLLVSLVELIDETNLINIGISEKNDKFGASIVLDLNDLKTTKTPLEVLEVDKLDTDAKFNNFIQNKVLQSLLNNSNKVVFDQYELNIIVNYVAKDLLTNNELLKQEVYKDYEVLVLSPYIELSSNSAFINIPLRLGKGLNYFKSNIMFEVDFSKNNSDLLINVKNIKFGDILISDSLKQNLFDIINQGGSLITNNSLVVPNFFDAFSDADLEVGDPVINNSKLEFAFTGIDVSSLMDDILNDFSNDDIKDIASDIINAIDNDLDYDNLIDDLIDTFDTLTETEQNELFDIISNNLGSLIP